MKKMLQTTTFSFCLNWKLCMQWEAHKITSICEPRPLKTDKDNWSVTHMPSPIPMLKNVTKLLQAHMICQHFSIQEASEMTCFMNSVAYIQ